MRVALIGATGFVGGYIVDALLAAGHQPSVLVRRGSEHKVRQPDRCRTVTGSISDSGAIAELLGDADAAIYLVGILREAPSRDVTFTAMQYDGARRCIDIAADKGLRRFLLMSANGVQPEGMTPYQRSKYRAEQYLRQSGLAWTVFRPSVIFGDPRGATEFCTQLRDQMVRPPVPAVSFFSGISPSRGAARMSPVHVADVAAAFCGALTGNAMIDRVLPLGGPEVLSWPDIVQRIALACGRRKWVLPVPVALMRLPAMMFDRFGWFPVTRDQLTMLMHGNTVRDFAAFDALGIAPQRLSGETLGYLSN